MLSIDGIQWLVLALLLIGLVLQYLKIRELKQQLEEARRQPTAPELANNAVRILEMENFKITNLFHQAFDHNPDSCFILTPGGRFTFINKAAIRLCQELGKSVQDLMVGENLHNISPAHLPNHFHEHYFNVVEEQTSLQIEYTEPPDGRRYAANYVPVKDGDLTYVLVVIRRIEEEA